MKCALPEHATTEHKPNVDKEQHTLRAAPYSSYLITTLFELSDFYLFLREFGIRTLCFSTKQKT